MLSNSQWIQKYRYNITEYKDNKKINTVMNH